MKKIIILFVIILIVLLVTTSYALAPKIEEIAVMKTKGEIQIIISETISEILEKNNFESSEIIVEQTDNNGKITGLQINSSVINKIYTDFIREINIKFAELRKTSFDIPISLVCKNVLIFGKGPSVKFTVLPASSIEAKIENNFISAGINQTKYQTSIIIKSYIVTALPLKNIFNEFETNLVIAESVIIGEVPDYFRNIT